MYCIVFYITSLVLSCVLSTHNKRILYCIVSRRWHRETLQWRSRKELWSTC